MGFLILKSVKWPSLGLSKGHIRAPPAWRRTSLFLSLGRERLISASVFYKGSSTMRKRSLLLDKRTENRLHSLPFLYFFFKFFFFLMWTIFEVIIELATILLLFPMFFSSASFFFFFVCFWVWGMWDRSYPTTDRTCVPCIGRQSLNHWAPREVPKVSWPKVLCLSYWERWNWSSIRRPGLSVSLFRFSPPVVSNSLVTPRGVIARQAPLSTGFPRQEYWSGLPFPPPGDLPHPGDRTCISVWAFGHISKRPLTFG